jgi:hypothetical protein
VSKLLAAAATLKATLLVASMAFARGDMPAVILVSALFHLLSSLARSRSGRRYRETPLSSHGVMTAAANRARAASSANDRRGEFQRRLYRPSTEVCRWPLADGYNRGDQALGAAAFHPAARYRPSATLYRQRPIRPQESRAKTWCSRVAPRWATIAIYCRWPN